MSLVEPNFSEVQDTVSPGVYNVRVIKGEVGKWEGKDGKPDTTFINFEMETFGEEKSDNNGRKIWDRVPITGKGAFKMMHFYKACTNEELTKESAGFDLEQLIGKEFIITMKEKDGYVNAAGYKSIQ